MANTVGYQPYKPGTEEDWAIINWLSMMRTDGDIDHTLSKSVNSPSDILIFFRSRPLFYLADEFGGITTAVWVESNMGATFVSFWAHKARRAGGMIPLFFLYDIIDECFKYGSNAIGGLIKERATPAQTDAFIRVHERLGYKYCGRMPKFFDGENAHLVAMTKEEWENLNGRTINRWRQRAEQADDGRGQGLQRHGDDDAPRADLQWLNGSAEPAGWDDGRTRDDPGYTDWWGEYAEWSGAFAG